ncbi:hypothetical protein SSPO_003540 [Streptomyces antimycoticus]|uniref:Uncharacterized protein n=1 Tax=Streptomyces antimycoticus TaxID=68175 RepID=A0A499ULH9_9ACTN|nr:hypothetical protein [Streptomyces antimycoticus]BBJ37636.1 hypothetical protein SSPO_003540 [Streptomyces antimycoticus]
MAVDALRLHEELDRAHGGGYALYAFGGYRQPTRQSAQLTAGGLDGIWDLDGTDHFGDGRVPRFSCFPAQLTDDSSVRFFTQKHGAPQNERALLNQVEVLLTVRGPGESVCLSQEGRGLACPAHGFDPRWGSSRIGTGVEHRSVA